jgi:hypothetical protein
MIASCYRCAQLYPLILEMSFLSRLRLKKNDKDPARSQSRVVEAVQNEGTSAKTDTKVCRFYTVFSTI